MDDQERVGNRTARVLEYLETVEPLLRRTASVEIDTTAPIDQIVETILGLVWD